MLLSACQGAQLVSSLFPGSLIEFDLKKNIAIKLNSTFYDCFLEGIEIAYLVIFARHLEKLALYILKTEF